MAEVGLLKPTDALLPPHQVALAPAPKPESVSARVDRAVAEGIKGPFELRAATPKFRAKATTLPTLEGSERNLRMLELAEETGRNIIAEEDREAFLDPEVPLERVFGEGAYLGSGNLGRINLHTYAGRKYAVKELSDASGLAEYVTGLRFDHDGLMKVYGSVVKAGCQYIIMEYIEGQTLDRDLSSFGPERARLALHQLFDAYAHALSSGLVPADVRPPNLMTSKEGPLKLIDFGFYFEPDPDKRLNYFQSNFARDFWRIAESFAKLLPEEHLANCFRELSYRTEDALHESPTSLLEVAYRNVRAAQLLLAEEMVKNQT